ncbi:MAG TPA: 50S ribosomal protein L5 [bacterium]|jgi:large subunit ribosomal protein L5|nr:50S ribosomal protein L5 [bacterium]
MSARLHDKYKKEVVPVLTKDFGLKNIMEVPKVEKVVINVGMGGASQNIKVLDAAVAELVKITGQKPLVTRSKKAISNFKIRENMPIGAKVTLRGARMYEFLDRLINIAIPRIRDFRGVSNRSFDGRGNYTLGVKEQIIFPEIEYDKVEKIHGMDVCIVTTAPNNDQAKRLLQLMGMPFRN